MARKKQRRPQVGVKHDGGKYRFSLLQGNALELVMAVGEFGSEKYGDHNYRNGMAVTRFLDAGFRHVFIEWLFKGRDLDVDPNCATCISKTCKKHSGLHHLAHGAWNFLSALEIVLTKPEFDNRHVKKIDNSHKNGLKRQKLTQRVKK